MESFEELIKNSLEQLKNQENYNENTGMLRGIGYALLALAISVEKENKILIHRYGISEKDLES